MELSGESAPAQQWTELGDTDRPTLEEGVKPEETVRSQPKLQNWLWEFLQTVLLTILIFVAVRTVVQNFQIDGPSMQPTLKAGQYLLVNKLAYLRLEGKPLQVAHRVGLFQGRGESAYLFGGPQRGDIIVFREPVAPYIDLVKRLIALPGDRVQIERGRVYVNGVLLQEDYIRSVPTYSLPLQEVPLGHFFVLGDNRPVSSDSHLWGFVPEANVIGKAWIRYWPPDVWGVLAGTSTAGN